MNNLETCKAFVAGAKSGRGSNLFFGNGTIYSYGTHFPMAKIIGNTIVMHKEKYSRSTSQHQSYLRRAIENGGRDYIYTDTIEEMNRLFMVYRDSRKKEVK